MARWARAEHPQYPDRIGLIAQHRAQIRDGGLRILLCQRHIAAQYQSVVIARALCEHLVNQRLRPCHIVALHAQLGEPVARRQTRCIQLFIRDDLLINALGERLLMRILIKLRQRKFHFKVLAVRRNHRLELLFTRIRTAARHKEFDEREFQLPIVGDRLDSLAQRALGRVELLLSGIELRQANPMRLFMGAQAHQIQKNPFRLGPCDFH